MALTTERKGEIALLMLIDRLKREGLTLAPSSRRDLHATAKRIGVPAEELAELVLEILPRLIGAAFGYEKVGLTTEGPMKPLPQEPDYQPRQGHPDSQRGGH